VGFEQQRGRARFFFPRTADSSRWLFSLLTRFDSENEKTGPPGSPE
jgi:hypothetical protein